MAALVQAATFGSRLRKRREDLGVTQAQIGRTVGRSGAAVSSLVDLAMLADGLGVDLAMLADGLGVSVDYLVVGDRRGALLLGGER